MVLRKINPMVRAVGTMGAVAAVAGGITFAALTSNTVALSANTLSSVTAHLQIGSTCANVGDTAVQGMDLKLAPGVKSDDFNFCLKNTGDVPLDLSASIPAADLLDSPIPGSAVKLDIACENTGEGHGASATLAAYASGTSEGTMVGTLQPGDDANCKANATLDADYNGAGTTVKPFTLNFVGTQGEATTEPAPTPTPTPTPAPAPTPTPGTSPSNGGSNTGEQGSGNSGEGQGSTANVSGFGNRVQSH